MKNNILLCFVLLILSTGLQAQTGSTGAPEFMQFQQAGTSDLVNPATGTFSYQIPLFTIGGYPMNLTYQSGILMEDVASGVGLGWNLNAGSIVRTLRGLPDDFNKDIIIKEFSVKENITFGGKVGGDVEIAGLSDIIGLSVGAEMGVFFNNYKGWGLEPSLKGSLSACFHASGGVGGSASLGMGVSVNSQSGVDKYISPSIGFKLGKGNSLSISLGKTWSVNSTEGLKSSMNTSLSYARYNGGTRKGVVKNKKTGKNKTTTYNDQSSFSLLGYGNRSYLNNSFNPDIDYPFENVSGTYSGTLGLDFYYVDPGLRITGYFSIQRLATKKQYFCAIGTMYENESMPPNTLMDFNREKKLPYYLGESKILPIPYRTPDVFNLNAQGLSMTFSVCKNDIGVVGDARSIITSNGTQAGIEANLGNLTKVGLNFGTTTSYQTSYRWVHSRIKFEPEQKVFNDNLYQQFCFKNHGEINKFDHSAFSNLGNYNPITFLVSNATTLEPYLSNAVNIFGISFLNAVQPVRQSTINYLTAAEASVMGLDKELTYFKFDDTRESINRTSGDREDYHLSEINVTQPDGMKYVFGIPVYNTTQREVTFNVGENSTLNCDKNLVTYSGTDNSIENKQGIDEFFEATTTPAYVTQFLITAVLSPDYRDITNNGITEDDVGNYVKFNYYKEDSLYRWRTPVGLNQATYNKGLRSDEQDDKGTYIYGEREAYYLRSMKSKTEIALFYYSKRADGYGVNDENGGKDVDNFLRKLDSIRVYSLPDYSLNLNNAVPIKTILFSYNYSLCDEIDNGSNGKLTLDKVAFTYERSMKGKHTPYVFRYGVMQNGDIKNPDYNVRDVNRWGYYQPNPPNAFSDCNNNSALSNIDYPYASQNKAEMDKNAYAWNLTDITIPGGGKLRVDYEAHDYAYIQDKTAGQMFMVSGVGDINGNILYNDDFDPLHYISNTIDSKIYFKLFDQTNATGAQKELEEKYIKDIKDGFLYYKFYVNLRDGKYEYITGYAKVEDFSIASYPFAYIDLKDVDLDDDIPDNGTCNPVLKTALQFMRINRNKMIFSNQPDDPVEIGDFVKHLPDIMGQLGAQIEASDLGVNWYCKREGFCENIDLTKSFIRLYNPVKSKIAGGSRVCSISINDNWAEMAGVPYHDQAYTTYFTYTTTEKDPDTEIVETVSSGVADYEPMIGGDEISLKQPIFYSDKKKKAPDNDYYVEEPVNEPLFPAPQITYSKVTQITNQTTENVGKTGKIVNEYFTSKDFPVKVRRTPIFEERDKTEFNSFQLPVIASDQQHDFATVSQGFSIELNNMSGLPKATWVYNENGDRISGEVMEYAPDNDNFTTIDRFGVIHRGTKLGLSVEYTIDGRNSYDRSETDISQLNLNISLVGPIPVPVAVPLFSTMIEEKQFRSFVTNKVIHRNALLKSKTVYSQSASITTENLAYDEVTGEAILTKTTNEFNDTLYSFKYPAYWMYEGMGPSYKNTKMDVNSLTVTDLLTFLKPGDEIRSINNVDRLWYMRSSGNQFEDEYKTPYTLNGTYQVYNSGAKNLLTAAAGQVVTWNYNPATGSVIDFIPADPKDKNILNSSAIEYYDSAVIYCDTCRPIFRTWKICDTCRPIFRTCKINEYLSGQKGNWKPKRTWFYLTERTPENLSNGVTNIREQGLFDFYNDFWQLKKNLLSRIPPWKWKVSPYNWEWKEKVNLTDVDGLTIETEDRIGRKVASLLGYKNTLITAQAYNTAYHEAFFDGFEDYNFSYCPNSQANQSSYDYMKRVKLTSGSLEIDNSESHTGKYSIKVSSPLTFTELRPYLSIQPKATTRKCTKCIGGFSPEKNKTYVFSCWVKVNSTQQPVLSCRDASVKISSGSGSLLLLLRSEGPVIEGWQRIMGTFETDQNGSISVTLNSDPSSPTYYDDIRIIPDNGNMVSYVYDDVNLRLTNILDENNYFTKYEYNNQGELIRIKKESERGIFTIKEANQALTKQP